MLYWGMSSIYTGWELLRVVVSHFKTMSAQATFLQYGRNLTLGAYEVSILQPRCLEVWVFKELANSDRRDLFCCASPGDGRQ